MHYQSMEVFHNTSLSSLIVGVNKRHLLNLIPKVPHVLDFLRTENVSLTNGYAKLFFAILTFKCLKSVTTLLSLVNFLLINITGLECAENPYFSIPI